MKIALNLCMLLIVICIANRLAEPASAAGPMYGSYYAGHQPFYGSGVLYGSAERRMVPPYFSIHPPVYYSHIVPRSYDYSPWALLPGMVPAESKVAPQPEMIPNPHFKPKQEDEKTKKTSDQMADSKIIINPFFAGSLSSVPARLTTAR